MHPGALLDASTELLRSVLRFDAPADGVVSAYFRRHHRLGARERHTLAETTYEVLRRRLLWTHLAKRPANGTASMENLRTRGAPAGQSRSGAGSLERRLAMLAWQGDAGFLAAALTPSEREWLADTMAVSRASLPDPLRHNLPDWLAQTLIAQRGEAAFWPLADALQQPAPLVLRVNPLKAKRDAVHAELAAAGIAAEPTAWSPWGLRLQGKPALQKLPAFLRGDFEVQDEGSQLLALLAGAKRGEMVVDFCAGAGGKTLALGAAMRSSGRLYAFDVSGKRLDNLKPRLARSGLSNVYPIQIAHERDERIKRLAGKIDRVLVDAPCSGLGTLRRNPDLKWRQTEAGVAELVAKQLAILTAAARLLKPGGRLVYATCSLLSQENQGVAEAFESQHPAFQRLSAASVLAGEQVVEPGELVDPNDPNGDLRLAPDKHGTDGFYAAIWQLSR